MIAHSCRALSNDERRALWAVRYYGGGHHRMTTATRTPPRRATAPDNSPRAARGSGDAATFLPPRYAFEGVPESDLPTWHPDSLRYAGP